MGHRGFGMGGSKRLTGWLVYGFAVVAGISVACARGSGSGPGSTLPPATTDGGGDVPDAGTPDAGQPDAGSPPDGGGVDGGSPGGIVFGTPGPWPAGNVTFTQKDGLLAGDLGGGVVGITTDESENIWVATHNALYVMRAPTKTRPGDTTFQLRFDGTKGKHLKAPDSYAPDTDIHLQNNPIEYTDHGLAGMPEQLTEKISSGASDPGITEIVGGGPNEVFVGYFSFHDFVNIDPNDSTSLDPNRHTGKVDRVRLKDDGNIEVVRFDLVSGNTTMFWHCRNIERMAFDHFIHKHELYVGTEHGIDKLSPDKWFQPKDPQTGAPKSWVYIDNQYWLADHLHPRVCRHHVCEQAIPNAPITQMMGDWRALAIGPDGDLWVGGKWSAGKIIYTELAAELKPDGTPNPEGKTGWYQRDGSVAYAHVFGDPWCGSAGVRDEWNGSAWVTTSCSPGTGTPPVFMPPEEGEPVFINGVTVAPNGVVWWSSPQHGIASFEEKVGFKYFDPSSMGVAGTVTDLVALPDGRIVVGSNGGGLTFWDPVARTSKTMRAGSGLPDDQVNRLELDTMVNPPVLHVSTGSGGAAIRVFP
jgi:hypothetical protein